MNEEAIRFKTSIHCGNCIVKVKSALDEILGEGNWQVDMTSADKILETQNESFDKEELILRLAELGYAASEINN